MIQSGNMLTPEDGYVLSNADVYSDRVYLSVLDSEDNWQESAVTEDILKVPGLYLDFAPGIAYKAGDKVLYEGALYKILQDHISQADWAPDAAPSLWAKVLIPDPETIPEWEQPESTNPYMTGDRVTHNGKTWTSIVDNNIWEPGVYGWEETEN